jgi:hypothetical protein
MTALLGDRACAERRGAQHDEESESAHVPPPGASPPPRQHSTEPTGFRAVDYAALNQRSSFSSTIVHR